MKVTLNNLFNDGIRYLKWNIDPDYSIATNNDYTDLVKNVRSLLGSIQQVSESLKRQENFTQ